MSRFTNRPFSPAQEQRIVEAGRAVPPVVDGSEVGPLRWALRHRTRARLLASVAGWHRERRAAIRGLASWGSLEVSGGGWEPLGYPVIFGRPDPVYRDE